MKKLLMFVAAASLGFGSVAIASKAPAPEIPKARAEAKAPMLARGKIIPTEFKNEGGGSLWSLDIQQKGHVKEPGIDGITGRVFLEQVRGQG